jgi:hypothetical protein
MKPLTCTTTQAACLVLGAVLTCHLAAARWPTNSYALGYAAAPPNNPLKGFMPYSGSYSTFPYSMEWSYLPLRSLMTGPTNFTWNNLETLLNSDASRAHHTVFRVYLDYPTLPTGIPQYLLDGGLTTYNYTNYDNDDISLSPNYEDPNLQQALTNFIAALGARYDGDPRIGFIELGLLGFWGEWHTFPLTNLFASVAVQQEVLAAYNKAFSKTKLLVRWPSGTNPAALHIGYHDDSFAFDTIDPPSYNFLGLLKAAGETNKWRTQPIGGEVYPPEQSCLWDTSQTNCVPAGQAFTDCVNLTHASWMLDQGVFDPGFTGAQEDLALEGAHQLGYEIYVTSAAIVDACVSGPLNLSINVLNTGVAPFYYDWPVQLGILTSSNTLAQIWPTTWNLSSLLPAGANTVWSYTQTNHGLPAGQYKCVLRVQNPLRNGVLFSFANAAQNADVAGWLTLGQFSVVAVPTQPTLTGKCYASGFELTVSNAAPGEWNVENTSNFSTWNLLLTTNTSTTAWSVTDFVALPAEFYRVVSSPEHQ